jgi:hypothetical protein
MRFTSLRGARGGIGQRSLLSLVLVMGVLAMIMLLPAAGLARTGKATVQLFVQQTHHVVSGDSVTFTARVKGGTIDKTKVTLQRKDVGSVAWSPVTSKDPSGLSGLATFVAPVTRNASFRVAWTGPGLTGAKYSNTVKILVDAKLTVKATIGVYGSGTGTPVTINGVLSPAWNGGHVVITVSGPDSVTGFNAPLTAGVGDTSVYSVTWHAMAPGTYSIRAKVARKGTPTFFGTSAWTEITL